MSGVFGGRANKLSKLDGFAAASKGVMPNGE